MDFEKKSDVLGLIAMFIIFIVFGMVLNYVYIVLQDVIPNLLLAGLAGVGYGFVLLCVVMFLKRILKITSNVPACILIILAMLFIYYMNWTMFIALWIPRFGFEINGELVYYYMRPILDFRMYMDSIWWILTDVPEGRITHLIEDIRFLNEVGTWGTGGAAWTGARIGIVWVGEFLIMFILPVYAAAVTWGLFLHEKNAWADTRLLPYAFAIFDKQSLTRIEEGDIQAIIEQPLASSSTGIMAVALCYVNEERTEYIAVFNASFDKKGEMNSGSLQASARLTLEKIDELVKTLEEKYTETNISEIADEE